MLSRKIILTACVLLSLAWLAGVMVNSYHSPQPTVTPEAPSSADPTTPEQTPSVSRPASPSSFHVPDHAPAAPPVVMWENRRDEILQSSVSSTEKADQLMALLPHLGGADQEEAARHLANLLTDDHFTAAADYLTNARAPEAVQSILLADLLNRPEKVKLPLWLAIARTPDHPHAGDAQNLLSLHVPEDLGTNWPAWEVAVQARLQANP